MTLPNTGFDSLEYWRTRHDQFKTDLKGVGNAGLDSEENERIYATIERYVSSLAAQLKTTRSAGSVLDLGCGIGMLAKPFIDNGLDYTGIDISSTAVAIASERHPAGRFRVGNIADVSGDEKFDIIIERTVFIHLIENAYWRATLQRVSGLLAPGGVFVMIDQLPTDEASAPRSATHVKFRLRQEYEAEFRAIGLRFDADLRAAIDQQLPLTPHTHFVTRA